MRFGFLSKYFPPENFLKPSCIGVSFSDSNIKAISFDKSSTDPILKSAIMPIEKGIISNGSIVNAEELVKKLSVVRKDFDSPFVFFTVPDESTYVFSASIPVSAGGNASESVAFIIEENVPLALSEATFDFVPTKIFQTESDLSASVVVAACAKKEVEKFVDVLRRSGFEPMGCLHESQAVANALIPRKSPGTLCIVHARESRVGIYLVRDGLVLFATLRSIVEGDYKKQFMDEYRKFLEYCLKYDVNQNQPIKTVLVCGEFEYAKSIVEMVSSFDEKVGDVKLSNVWTNILEIDKHLPGIPYEKSLSFAGTIGAALAEVV